MRNGRTEMRRVHDLIPTIDTLPTRMQSSYPEIREDDFWDAYRIASPYSMVHITGFYQSYQALR